ncbi:hypothetical protein CWB96_07930 [Pseudoalteromonas citrea]|uniref:Peptidase MA-like domain-containing protein n=2 Tax=Pseudoalteromonas TaxID=53246 RepID=A0A5S3XR14_9GAMM|nr:MULTISPECIES: hypothetical protein [Pseudoalteromonas]TMO60478.1 hypothetical protein CWC18_13780 [Pseudoalteromonas aurantia]TMO79045.1 hypothetical protein CWC20_00040 [Pseudoalteromonas aurantia]TMP38801.1 hypothetical protein CWB97_21475 [Pseudoalteromonas citrea]TMP60133.1 hypothetical protein CWB96_07930 [Pseudoalteromonas citrea]
MIKKYLVITLLFSTSSFAKTFDAGDFTVEYDDNVPTLIVEQLAQRVSENRKIVKAYLHQSKEYKGTPIQDDLVVYISKKRRTPYQDWNTIHIPEKRVLSAFSAEESENSGMAVIHELAHVYAVSYFRKKKKDRFFDDGLAVFLQHRFGESPEYPNFGQDLYRAVAETSISYGGLIALAEAETVRHAAKTGVGRRLAYLQEGAFTQYLIENYGLDQYLKIYAGENMQTVTGKTFSQLEKEWVALIGEFTP